MEKRIFGPLLSSAEAKTVYAGNDELERMKSVRLKIEHVRAAWKHTPKYLDLVETVRNELKPETQPKSVRAALKRILETFHDYGDTNFDRPVKAQPEIFASLELYCTQEGYDLFFATISRTLRLREASNELLVAAVTLVEFLTIDLYNLRLANIGNEIYSNFQGVVYRGLKVTAEQVQVYKELASRNDLTKRNFSIPLMMTSASTEKSVMEKFASEDWTPGLHALHLEIHVHGVDPGLLQVYLERYPESIVTSICAMPVARISTFSEKEVLLRGAFFHIISMRSHDVSEGRPVHSVTVVMMNSNRDHVSESSSNEAHKKTQRSIFQTMVNASKYEVCAKLAAAHSESDASSYRSKQLDLLRQLRAEHGLRVLDNTSLAAQRSHPTTTWIGASMCESLPAQYADRRLAWQKAIKGRDWNEALDVLGKDYDWDENHWFNVGPLHTSGDDTNSCEGYTALHWLAKEASSKEGDRSVALEKLLAIARKPSIWKTLPTFDRAGQMAQDIANENSGPDLVATMQPCIQREISQESIQILESKLHDVMLRHAQRLIEEHKFRLPRMCIFIELEAPELWVPVPHMYGGFRLELLSVSELKVVVFETIVGLPRPKRTEYILHG